MVSPIRGRTDQMLSVPVKIALPTLTHGCPLIQPQHGDRESSLSGPKIYAELIEIVERRRAQKKTYAGYLVDTKHSIPLDFWITPGSPHPLFATLHLSTLADKTAIGFSGSQHV